MSYRKSASEWEWHDGAKHYAVRVFVSTRKLIWSSWVEMSGAPVFDDGFAQSFEGFLRGDPFPFAPPQAVLDDLRALLASETQPKSRGLFHRLRKS